MHKEIQLQLSGAEGHTRENDRYWGNRLINKQIPSNPDLRKETSALCQIYFLAFAVMMALALHLPKEKNKQTNKQTRCYHTVSPALPAGSPSSSFIPPWATRSGESDRPVLLCVSSDQTSIFGCADVYICMGPCVCMCMWDCTRIWAHLNINTDLTQFKFQVPLPLFFSLRFHFI